MHQRTIDFVQFLYRDGATKLAVFSHGSGSTPQALRGLATYLADVGGYVAAMIEHPGNNRNDNTLADTRQILEDRPRHVRRAIDLGLAEFAIADVCVIGHSLGGYTALAVVGGAPWSLPPDARPLAVEHDLRVRAVVLLAPALPWFMPEGSLANVRARVMVRTGERDPLAPPAFVASVLRDLPRDEAIVPNAGHFAFFWPVPPPLLAMPPGQDPPGFDRAAYQPQLYAETLAFLEREVPADDLR